MSGECKHLLKIFSKKININLVSPIKDYPLEINITLNEAAKTITIFDKGCGMTKQSLVEDLGTIARSGS